MKLSIASILACSLAADAHCIFQVSHALHYQLPAEEREQD